MSELSCTCCDKKITHPYRCDHCGDIVCEKCIEQVKLTVDKYGEYTVKVPDTTHHTCKFCLRYINMKVQEQ